MASKQASEAKATSFSDGTTDYQPLRSTSYDMKKPHITEQPMTWSNWYQHLDWLSIYFIIIVPISGLIAATQTPLRLYTAMFAVVYYVICGSGITAGTLSIGIAKPREILIQPKGTIDYGHIRVTKRPSLSRSTWQLLELALLRVQSDGGQEDIAPITDTQIRRKIPTPSKRASGIRTWVGWL